MVFVDTKEFDIVVIGAGVMGLSSAYYLSEMGLKVCVVDRENYIGGYTTLRCAGGIRQQFSSQTNIYLSLLNKQKLREIENETRSNIPFNHCGYAFAFTKDDSASQAEKYVKIQREMSVNTEYLSSKDLTVRFPHIRTDDVRLTTYCRDDGLIDVGTLLGLLKHKLYNNNVKVLCKTTVCGIETQNRNISKVILDKGEIKTTMIVNATGPWSKQIGSMVGVTLPIEPSTQQLWITEPISWIQHNMPVVIFADEGVGFHVESRGLLSGYNKPNQKEKTLFPEIDIDWEILHCKKAVERIPSIYDRQLVSRWAGFYETTIDDHPIVGPCGPSGMYCIAGFNGHGIMHALACGYLLSQIMIGNTSEINNLPLSFSRFGDANANAAEKEKYRI